MFLPNLPSKLVEPPCRSTSTSIWHLANVVRVFLLMNLMIQWMMKSVMPRKRSRSWRNG